MKFGVGQPVRRHEDLRLITGQGRYTDDVVLPRMTQAFVLRSPVAHAHIKRIDASAARRMPGVLFVGTGEDVRADGLGDVPCTVPLMSRDGKPRHDTPRPVLALGKVRHVGQPVALVVAETLAAARDAAEAIEVEYDTLPAVTDAKDAIGSGAPQLFDHIPNNIVFDWDNDTGDAKATDAAFAKAARVVSARPRQQSRRGQFDGAAQRHCRIRSGKRPLDALHRDPRRAFRARSARRDRAQIAEGQAAPDHAQCRRRLWHEGLRLSRARARGLGEPQDRAAGEMAGGSLGRFRLRQSGPRPRHPRRAGARRQRPLPRFARFDPRQYRRLSVAVRLLRADALDRSGVGPLCDRRDPRQRQGRLHQHRAGLRLSRRRAARGRLSARAAGRRRGARARQEPRRHPPHQFRAAVGDALHVGDKAHARFRRVRKGHGPVHGRGGMADVRQAAQAKRARRQAARHRHGDLYRALRRRLSGNRVDRIQGR